jgi:hypothetical protein
VIKTHNWRQVWEIPTILLSGTAPQAICYRPTVSTMEFRKKNCETVKMMDKNDGDALTPKDPGVLIHFSPLLLESIQILLRASPIFTPSNNNRMYDLNMLRQ